MAVPGYEGWGALGDVIAGGPGRRAEAEYPTYLRESATAASALEKAAIARSQRIARENLPAAVAADPLLGQRADLASAILGMAPGQPNLGTYTGGLGDIADMEIDAQIRQKLALGDVAGAQVLSAVKTDKVLPEVAAAGKMVFTPVTGATDMTALGDAAVGAQDALAGQRAASGQASLVRADAAAGLARTRAANVGTLTGAEVQAKIDWITAQANQKIAKGESEAFVEAWMQNEMVKAGITPQAPADFSGVAGQATTVPLGESDDPLLAQARAAIAAGADPAKVRQRLIELERGDLAGAL